MTQTNVDNLLVPGHSNLDPRLREMPDQIRYYFMVIEKLTRKYFYTKQWKETTIPYENVVIRQAGYPVGENWRQIYARECRVQNLSLEALYDLS